MAYSKKNEKLIASLKNLPLAKEIQAFRKKPGPKPKAKAKTITLPPEDFHEIHEKPTTNALPAQKRRGRPPKGEGKTKEMRLTREEMLQIQLCQARMEANRSRYKLAQTHLISLRGRIEALINEATAKIKADHDPRNIIGGLEMELADMDQTFLALQDSEKEKVQEIEARLGVKFKDYSYDDETGQLVHNSAKAPSAT